jgi:excisionase family DNA binding protein
MYVGRRKGPQGCLDECAMDRELRHGWIAASRPSIDLPSARKKMIMTVQTRDKLMSLTDVSEMLGIPVQTLYRWRCKGDGPAGYRVGRHVRYRREAVEA